MSAVLGWAIIVVVMCSINMALLWPAYRLVRRSYPRFKGLPWAYAAATAGCSLALWYLIPLVVYELFGRARY